MNQPRTFAHYPPSKFWSNTGAVAGTFAGVGVLICLILLVVGYYKRQKSRPRTIDFGRFSKLPETNEKYPQEKAPTPAPPAPAYSAQHYQQEQEQQMQQYRDVEARGQPTYQYDGYDFAMVSGFPSRQSEAPMPIISPLNPRRSPSPPSLTPTRRAPSPPSPVRYTHTRTPSPTTPPVQVRRYQPPSTYDLFTVPPPAPRPAYSDGRTSPVSKYSDQDSFYGPAGSNRSPSSGNRSPRGGF